MRVWRCVQSAAICTVFYFLAICSLQAAPVLIPGTQKSDTPSGVTLAQLSPQAAQQIRVALNRVKVTRNKFGPKHPNYAKALYDLAELYARLGQIANAKRYYQAAINVWQGSLGPKHPLTLRAKARLAAVSKTPPNSTIGAAKPQLKPNTQIAKPAAPSVKKKTFNYAPPKPAYGQKSIQPQMKSVQPKAAPAPQQMQRKSYTNKPAALPKAAPQRQRESAAPSRDIQLQRRSMQRQAPPPGQPRSIMREGAPPPSAGLPRASGQRAPPVEREMAARPPMSEERSVVAEDENAPYQTVRVFYATDRDNTGRSDPGDVYGVRRSTMQYGICDVSIPRDHRMGELEAPSLWRLEWNENPERHVVLMKVEKQDEDIFFGDIRRRVRQSGDKSAFIFVHGYNTTFEHAARRTAQMTYDLGFEGAPVFYSWPSQGTTSGYTVDENNIVWTEPHLKRFVKDFVKRSNADKIFLVAHSMGTRALSNAVADLAQEDPSVRDKIEAVILAAPDIDADVFKTQILPRMNGATKNLTLYASSRDNALLASKRIHGYPRAGDAGDGLVIADGLDTIDASDVDTSLIGHSYFAEAKSIISDLYAILTEGRRARDRTTLKPVKGSSGTYWRFR